jgi:plasmid maintenance system antidote protein VapI
MNLSKLIDQSGVKRKWLADELGYSQAGLSLICTGARQLPAAKIILLAALIGCPTDDVLAAMTQTRKETAHAEEAEGHVAE